MKTCCFFLVCLTLLGKEAVAQARNSRVYTKVQAKAQADSLYQVLRRGESFEALVQEFSQDVASYPYGGDMGWITPKGLLLPYRKAVMKLKKGQYTRPILTPNGYYLAQLIDKRANEVRTRYLLIRIRG